MNENVQMTSYRPKVASTGRKAGSRKKTLSQNVRHLHQALSSLLEENERHDFIRALNDYHHRRNVFDFVQCLKLILNTSSTVRLIPLLRKVIPNTDQDAFDAYMHDTSNSARPENGFLLKPVRNGVHIVQPSPIMHLKGSAKTNRQPSEPSKYKSMQLSYSQLQCDTSSEELRRICIKQNLNASTSGESALGFSIRGGTDHGMGIYVSFVDDDSSAAREGLLPGDLIVSVNDVTFSNITQHEATKIFKKSKKLEIIAKNVGRIPGSYVAHQTYTWVDPRGRPVSPPPEVDRAGRYEAKGQRKSGLMLLKASDERKVNLVVSSGKTLGLMIRGGSEFGLGIYITGVDPQSVAQNAGIKVGDQLLDCNGQSFLDITHSEACAALKSSKHMIMTIKDVGRLPYAKTTIDQTQWITGPQLNDRIGPWVNGQDIAHKKSPQKINALKGDKFESVFSRGAGSQLMFQNTMISQQRVMIEDQARQLLNDTERETMNYYISEYSSSHVSIEALVIALLELFNTQAKLSLMSEIRGLVIPKDIDKFDTMVLQREVECMKARNPHKLAGDQSSVHSFSSLSTHSGGQFSLPSSLKDSFDGSFSHIVTAPHIPAVLPPNVKLLPDTEEMTSSFSANMINDDIDGLPDYFSESVSPNSSPSPPIESIKASRHSNSLNLYETVDIHHHIKHNSKHGEEDSGVDLHSTNNSTSTTTSSNGLMHISSNGGTNVHHASSYGGSNVQATVVEKDNKTATQEVTISPTRPITISSNTQDKPKNDENSNHIIKVDANGTEHLYGRVAPRNLRQTTTNVESNGTGEIDQTKNGARRNVVQMGVSHVTLAGQSETTTRRMSVDSAATESSTNSVTGPVECKSSSKRHYSDPTHHVPRDQQKTVDQKKKTSEQLLQIKRTENVSEEFQAPEGSHMVTVYKTKPTLGIAIEGGANTRQPLPRIINIQAGGSAHESGGLKVGHTIVAVEHRLLSGLEHSNVARAIAEAFKNKRSSQINFYVMEPDK